jgi:hypothetical protein
VQIDYKGQRVRAEVTKYDGTRAVHEVQWRSETGSDLGKIEKATVDFCRDLVYGETSGAADNSTCTAG